jgi:hypothetical protein
MSSTFFGKRGLEFSQPCSDKTSALKTATQVQTSFVLTVFFRFYDDEAFSARANIQFDRLPLFCFGFLTEI